MYFLSEGIYDKFMEKFVERVKKIKVGPPLDPSTYMGALITKEHLEKVCSYIELAKSEGGKRYLNSHSLTHSLSLFLVPLSFSHPFKNRFSLHLRNKLLFWI
jgi:acyl-CoA reductase-like NAD-dependent aldehyde dehydrogenase